MAGVLVEPVTDATASFDVRKFARTAVGCLRESFDAAVFAERPLSPATLRVLRYVRDVERSTMRYLRHVLVTPTHKDARVTAFLTTWAYEKYWVADAIDAVLEAHPKRPVEWERTPVPRAGWNETRDRFTPLWRSLVDNTLGECVIAAHMVTGAADEWMTQAVYCEVRRTTPHPELATILGVIQDIKARHLEFFGMEAKHLLERSALSRRLSRQRLRYGRWPVCVREKLPEENEFFFRRVFVPVPAAVSSVDARIRTLPGLYDLRLMRAAVRRYASL